jgi:beta-glucosidase
VAVPLRCFAGKANDLSHVDVPFGVQAAAPFSAAFADVRIAAAAAGGRAGLPCASPDVP